MECDICRRGHDTERLPFLCAVDARNQAYEGRIKHLQVLIESDGLRNQIQQLIGDSSSGSSDTFEMTQSQLAMTEDRTNQILETADKLKNEIKTARDEIQARRAALARRKSDLATASDGLVERRGKQQKEVEKSKQLLKYRWSQSAETMASTRVFLCAESARLYGLKRIVKKGSKTPEYHVGKVPIVDLMSMNTQSPEQITTSLGHISHVLMLASHYLSIRLPAEVTTPHREYPYPTILNLSNSYRHRKLQFPGTSGTTTPVASTADHSARNGSRPRPLYIHKPLPQLLKEDPAAYSFFLEGVTLLAYDIAWLCSSQGILIGDKNPFEEVCQMGRNLYSLLIHPPSYNNNIPTPDANLSSDNNDPSASPTPNWIGRYSHGTMYYSLNGAEGTELVKAFKLPSPMKLADKLKKKLVGDAPAPDWEVLSDDAWKVEDIPTEDLTETPKTTPEKAKAADTRDKSRRGSNGWTKVR